MMDEYEGSSVDSIDSGIREAGQPVRARCEPRYIYVIYARARARGAADTEIEYYVPCW